MSTIHNKLNLQHSDSSPSIGSAMAQVVSCVDVITYHIYLSVKTLEQVSVCVFVRERTGSSSKEEAGKEGGRAGGGLVVGRALAEDGLGRAGLLLAGLRGYSVVLWDSSSVRGSPSGEWSSTAMELRQVAPTLNSSSRLSRLTLMEGISKLKRSADIMAAMAVKVKAWDDNKQDRHKSGRRRIW